MWLCGCLLLLAGVSSSLHLPSDQLDFNSDLQARQNDSFNNVESAENNQIQYTRAITIPPSDENETQDFDTTGRKDIIDIQQKIIGNDNEQKQEVNNVERENMLFGAKLKIIADKLIKFIIKFSSDETPMESRTNIQPNNTNEVKSLVWANATQNDNVSSNTNGLGDPSIQSNATIITNNFARLQNSPQNGIGNETSDLTKNSANVNTLASENTDILNSNQILNDNHDNINAQSVSQQTANISGEISLKSNISGVVNEQPHVFANMPSQNLLNQQPQQVSNQLSQDLVGGYRSDVLLNVADQVSPTNNTSVQQQPSIVSDNLGDANNIAIKQESLNVSNNLLDNTNIAVNNPLNVTYNSGDTDDIAVKQQLPDPYPQPHSGVAKRSYNSEDDKRINAIKTFEDINKNIEVNGVRFRRFYVPVKDGTEVDLNRSYKEKGHEKNKKKRQIFGNIPLMIPDEIHNIASFYSGNNGEDEVYARQSQANDTRTELVNTNIEQLMPKQESFDSVDRPLPIKDDKNGTKTLNGEELTAFYRNITDSKTDLEDINKNIEVKGVRFRRFYVPVKDGTEVDLNRSYKEKGHEKNKKKRQIFGNIPLMIPDEIHNIASFYSGNNGDDEVYARQSQANDTRTELGNTNIEQLMPKQGSFDSVDRPLPIKDDKNGTKTLNGEELTAFNRNITDSKTDSNTKNPL